MTTRTTPSPIEILADAALRDAADAGAAVIVFDDGLNAVLFADAAGRAFLDPANASPALRQIRSAARSLYETGRATVFLRRSTRAGSSTVRAELTRRSVAGGSFVLAVVEGIGRALEAADIVVAAGLETSAAAVFAGGVERFATASFADRSPADIADRLARFEAGAESLAVEDDGARKLTFARAPFGLIFALAEESERMPAEMPASPADEPPAPPAPTQAGFATFSVKRAKIGDPRPGMSMSALLQRWHSRGPETVPPGEAELPPATVQDGEDLPARSIESTMPADAAVPSAEAAPSQEMAIPRAVSLRSNWGTPPVATDEAAAGEPAAPPTDPELEAAAPQVDAGEATESDEQDTPEDAASETVLGEPNAVEPVETAMSEDIAVPAEPVPADPEHEPPLPEMEDEAPVASPVLGAETPEPVLVEAPKGPVFAPRFDVPPVRFVWQIDRDGAFRFLSPDFAGAVGPNAADVVGRSFATVARVFGFDETREIARLLERRDTWSGRTILWPIQGSDRKVPVDLAALPVYGRDRSFDGFRGFGIVRLNESVLDEEGLGLLLTNGPPPPRTDLPSSTAADGDDTPPQAEAPREKPFLRRFEAESFGRRAEPPVPVEPEAETDETQKVIRLEERRRPREGALSSSEEAAFRAIGAKLGVQSEAESPGALRFEEPASAAKDEARADAPEATTAPVETAPEPASAAEPDGIEPALAALSEKLAQAEAEADRRLAARRQFGRTASAPTTDSSASNATTDPAAPSPPETSETGSLVSTDTAEREPADIEAPSSPSADAERPDAETATPDPVPAPVEPVSEVTQTSAAASEDKPAEVLEEPALTDEAADSIPAPIEANAPEATELGAEDDDDEDEIGEPPLDIAVFERLFAGLPLAVLVQVMENTVYTNAEFGLLTGHADAGAVEAAGGLDALVLDRQGEGTLALLRADGEVVEVHGHMQRIAEGGRSALLMSFSPVADEAVSAGPALDDLRQEVEELQAVLDTATDGVVLLDMAGSIRAMNGSAHALFGLGADEAFGRHVSTLFAHESQKATADYLDMLRDDGIGGILNDGREVIGRVAQGGFIPLFITIGRLTGERGWCVVIRDIAHWKRIEEDLVNARRQAEAASLHKSRFLANISHELRTPLNAIIGFADVMSSECFGPIGNERYLEYLGDIKRSGHHVLDLVNDLLDISKIEAGKIDLSFEAVSLNEVISEAVSLMQPQANRERVIVRSNLPSSVPPVVADRRTMRQIALNLLANAIKFTPAGGQIIASTTYSAEGDVLLRFRDSGIGMTEREIELALTPFQQVHAPSANRGEGTGLGLPLTKAMVEANRASFSIQSTPGEGTLVEIVFPPPRVLAD